MEGVASTRTSPVGKALDQNARWLFFVMAVLAAILAFVYGNWALVAIELFAFLLLALAAWLTTLIPRDRIDLQARIRSLRSGARDFWQHFIGYLQWPTQYRYGATAMGVVIGVILTILFGILLIAGTVVGPSVNWAAVATVVGSVVAATYYVTYLRHSRDTARRENLFKLQDEYNGSYVRRARFHLAHAFLNHESDASCLRTLMLLFQKLATMIERDEVDDSAAYGLFAIALIRWCQAAQNSGALANIQKPSSSWDRVLSLRTKWEDRYRDPPPDGISGFLQHEIHRSELDFATASELTASEISRLTTRINGLEKVIAELQSKNAPAVGG